MFNPVKEADQDIPKISGIQEPVAAQERFTAL